MSSKKISRLHFVTGELNGYSHAELARMACEGGVDWIQLRLKNRTVKEIREIAEEVRSVCEEYRAVFILNDYVELVKEVGAHGVHLGKGDMNPSDARKILGPELIIGASTNSELDILDRNEQPVDYIGLGPLRFTATRENLNPVLGPDQILRSCRLSKFPVIAIGGIVQADVAFLLKGGVHGVAVSSAISMASDPFRAAQTFIEECYSKELIK